MPRRQHDAMQLTLVLPALLTLPPAALAASPALAALARRSPPPRHDGAGIEAALLAVARLPAATPLAPLAARGAGIAVGAEPIARADPIALVAGRDDVLLRGRVDDLSMADTQAFIARLNVHFADDGLVFMAARADTWFVQLNGLAPPQTTPLVQVWGAIEAHLPRGPRAGQWKRWLSEMQMLLHDDPRNVARERAGRLPVTAVWIGDAGMANASSSAAQGTWFAPAGREGDLARGLAAQGPASVAPPPAAFASMAPASRAVVILPALRAPTDVDAVANAWLTPALAALDRGALETLAVIADGGRDAFVWTPRAASWWTRWRRSGPLFFVPPTAPEPR